MRIENLIPYVGKSAGRYSALCRILEEPERSNRKAQEDKWSKRFAFHKVNHEYIIDKIYDVPPPNFDKRVLGNRGVYAPMIQEIIIATLTTDSVAKTPRQWLKHCGLVNPQYTQEDIRTQLEKRQELHNQTEQKYKLTDRLMDNFIRITEGDAKKKFKDALNALIKLNIVTFGEIYKIVFPDQTTKTASAQEKEYIETVQSDVLRRLGCATQNELYLSGQLKQYNKLLKEQFEKNGWERVFIQWVISRSSAYVHDEFINVHDLRWKINEKFTDHLYKTIDKESDKVKAKYRYKIKEIKIERQNILRQNETSNVIIHEYPKFNPHKYYSIMKSLIKQYIRLTPRKQENTEKNSATEAERILNNDRL